MMKSHDARWCGDRGVSVKVSRETFVAIRRLATQHGATQRGYLERLAKLMEILAERSGGDPVQLLETIVGPRETDCP